MNSFNTTHASAARKEYDLLPPVAGTVIVSAKVEPHKVQPNWRNGKWAHLLVIETHTGEQITLGNSAAAALDIQEGDWIVIGEVIDNSKCNGLNFYSNKHTRKVTDQGFDAYSRLS